VRLCKSQAGWVGVGESGWGKAGDERSGRGWDHQAGVCQESSGSQVRSDRVSGGASVPKGCNTGKLVFGAK
jgi:hypothetical protein